MSVDQRAGLAAGNASGPAPDADIRRHLRDGLVAVADSDAESTRGLLAEICRDDLEWRGSHPLNELAGLDAIDREVWKPLKSALPDLERRDDIVVGGTHDGREYLACLGHYCGTFERPWLGIPPTGDPLYLRYGEVHRVERGRIVQSSCLWDVLDAMRQAGFDAVVPGLGLEGRWAAPMMADGVRLQPTAADVETGARHLAQTLAMQKTLGDYNDDEINTRDGLIHMPQREHWHPKMMWYGPGGIGTARRLDGFVDRHQLPFRKAFPTRTGGGEWSRLGELGARIGGGHYIRVGDGPYSVTGGWPSVRATHLGGSLFGVAATGRTVNMRVMDFYRHDQGMIRENWVPLDVIDLLLQIGVDVFERMQEPFARGRRHR